MVKSKIIFSSLNISSNILRDAGSFSLKRKLELLDYGVCLKFAMVAIRSWKPNTLCVKIKPVKSDQFFSGDQYFSATNNFIRLKLTPVFFVFVFYFFTDKVSFFFVFKKQSPGEVLYK